MTHDRGPRFKQRQPLWLTVAVLILAGVGAWVKYHGRAHIERPEIPWAPMPQAPPQVPASPPPNPLPSPRAPSAGAREDDSLARAVRARAQNVGVVGSGRIVKMLPDDAEGDRHQRILVEVGGGGTILIAHNIDLAPRVIAREADAVSFKGEYVWNDRGGVVHWTHRDPRGRHSPGWVRVNGATFQ